MPAWIAANWKTTVLGLVVALAAIGNVIPAIKPYSDIVMQVAMALGLVAAKDGNVTGGTKPNA